MSRNMLHRIVNAKLVSQRIGALMVSSLALLLLSCAPANTNGNRTSEKPSTSAASPEPVIEASPVTKSDEWQVINGDSVTLNVTAPGAQSVKILYRPAFAEGRHVELKKLTSR